MVILPPCPICGGLMSSTKCGICKTCYERRRVGRTGRRRFYKVYCDCGKPAVVVIVVRVSDHKELMPLCSDCFEIERKMEEEMKGIDHGRKNGRARIRGSRFLRAML